MPISALALLRIAKPETSQRVDQLSDGVIVHTTLAFSEDPEELSAALALELGPQLFAHADPRGIFFIPSVAAPSAQSYDGVVAEVGEGGVWGPSPTQLVDSAQHADLGELLGGMLSQLPPSMMASAQAALAGDPAALGAMTSQVSELLGSSPALAEMMRGVQQELLSDPAKLEELTSQLLGKKK